MRSAGGTQGVTVEFRVRVRAEDRSFSVDSCGGEWGPIVTPGDLLVKEAGPDNDGVRRGFRNFAGVSGGHSGGSPLKSMSHWR